MSKRLPVQASVTFHDVAVYFMEEEWGRLEERQKQRYREVMEEIHEALFSLGYSIINPDVLIRIKAGKGPDLCDRRVPKGRQRRSGRAAAQSGCILPGKEEEDPGSTDDFCFVKSGRRALFSGDTDDDEVTPDMLFRVKEEPEPYSIVPEESDEGDCMDGLSANDPEDDSELVIIVKKEPCDVELNNRDVIGIPAEDGASLSEASDVRSPEGLPSDLIPDELQTERPPLPSALPGHAEAQSCPWEGFPIDPGDGTPSGHSLQPPFLNDQGAETNPLHTESSLARQMPAAWELSDKLFSSRTHACRVQGGHESQSLYKCLECEKTFSKNSNLLRHQQIHTGERPYACSECDKNFVHKSSFIQHLRIHTGERPYKCTECEKSFRLSSTLVYHLTTHRVEKLFKCTECEKSFTLKATLVNHLRVHTGERPFKCTDCEKCFINFRNLQKHQRVHTGERPYTCPVCPKSFSNVSNQRRHQKTHTGEKPFRCPQCTTFFSQRSSLIKHQQMQRCNRQQNYNCKSCDKTFTKNSSLIQHMKTHTGERAFKCTVCGKTFSHNSTLTQHQRIHTGERPYQCSICEKAFRLSATLLRHYRKHTGEKPHKCTQCDKCFNHRESLLAHVETHNT
ncbi:zinc finger protein 436-like isoform X4 [Ambystoma mexicanum]|uniref:zinc finger protein 436-like isoform X4 n=1 Tax=Ambystoma mexicanum TaxID=8296 RepID=UPI0037E83E91